LVKATLAGLKSFFSAKINLNTAKSFSTTRKTVVKKAASKPQGGFLLLSGKFFNSSVKKECFSQLKETAQFSYMTWRE